MLIMSAMLVMSAMLGRVCWLCWGEYVGYVGESMLVILGRVCWLYWLYRLCWLCRLCWGEYVGYVGYIGYVGYVGAGMLVSVCGVIINGLLTTLRLSSSSVNLHSFMNF